MVCAVLESPTPLTSPTSLKSRTPSPVSLTNHQHLDFEECWKFVLISSLCLFLVPVWGKLKSQKASERWQPDTEVSPH